MPKVSNVNVYGLEESCIAAGYPMRLKPSPDIQKEIAETLDIPTKRAVQLAKTKIWEGHDNFLNWIIAQFDLTFSNKARVEAERYSFLHFVSSQSTMHRLTKMDFDEVFNEYVSTQTKEHMKELQEAYNESPTKENKLRLLYNAPSGLELTARMTTNYRQLKTIYHQRQNHLLPDWQMFCEFIRSLPHSYLITGDEDETDNTQTP